MKKNLGKNIILSVTLGISLFAAGLAEARPYWARAHDPRVNTRLERQYDLNHNGYIGPRERYVETHAQVNTPKEAFCDKNHNGFVGAHEAHCL